MRKTDNFARELIFTYYANRRLILRVFFLVSTLSVAVAFLWPPVWKLTGSFIVVSRKVAPPPESLQAPTAPITRAQAPTPQDVETETMILRSPQFLRMAAEEIKASGVYDAPPSLLADAFAQYVKAPLMAGVILPVRAALGLPAAAEEAPGPDKFWEELRDRMEIKIAPGSNVVEVELTDTSPAAGVYATNLLIDRFLAFRREVLAQAGESDFFKEQTRSYRQKIDALETRKNDLLHSANTAKPDQEIDQQNQMISELSREVFQLEDQLLEQQLWVGYLENVYAKSQSGGSFAISFPYDFQNPDIRSFNDRLQELMRQYAQSKSVYTDSALKSMTMKKQMDDLQRQLMVMIKNEISLKKKGVQVLQDRIEGKKARIETTSVAMRRLKQIDSELRLIDTEQESVRETFRNFFRKFEEARIEEAAEDARLSNVRVLTRASIPADPAFPKKKAVIPAGMLAGLLLGFSIGFIREFFDNTFKTTEHVETYLDLPVIASIALDEPGKRPGKLSLEA